MDHQRSRRRQPDEDRLRYGRLVDTGSLAHPFASFRVAVSANGSNDGGKSWFPASTGLGRTHGNIFVISPTGNSLFTGGMDGGVWVFHFARSRAAGD